MAYAYNMELVILECKEKNLNSFFSFLLGLGPYSNKKKREKKNLIKLANSAVDFLLLGIYVFMYAI